MPDAQQLGNRGGIWCCMVSIARSVSGDTRAAWVGCCGARECGVAPTYGVVMMTSASTSSWSNLEPSPSLSDVVTSVWPWSSIHLRIPSSFSVVPRRLGSCSACTPPYHVVSDHPATGCNPPINGLSLDEAYIVEYEKDFALLCRSCGQRSEGIRLAEGSS